MRQNYYDQNGWPQPLPGEGEGPRSEPYGAVPPQSTQGIVPRTAVKQPEPPLEEESRITPVFCRRGRGVRRFALLMALILVLTGTGILVNGGLPGSYFDRAEDIWDSMGPGYDWDYYDYDADDWVAELEDTTMALSAIGDGTVLELCPPGEEELDPRMIYARVAPSVVGIRVTTATGMATATGVVMTFDGYIITNAHVIAGAEKATVTLDGGGKVDALLVGYDASTDLAVLKVETEGLVPAEFGDSSALYVGEPAYAIGNPLGEELRGTMTDGIISAIDRSVDASNGEMTLLQTTAAINPGSSGGALVNASGQVVGITNMKMMSNWETIEGLGFAIPTALAKEVVDQIIDTGSYAGVPSIGITVRTQPPTPESPAGVYVSEVEEGSDAYAKGIRPGDIIIRANDMDITSIADLEEAKAGLGIGGTLKLTVWKGGRERTVSITLIGKNQM